MDNPGGICIGFSGPSSLLSHTSLSHPHPLPIHQKFPIFLPRSDILALGPKSGLGQINTRLLRSYPFSLSPWQSASLRVSEEVVWSQKKKKKFGKCYSARSSTIHCPTERGWETSFQVGLTGRSNTSLVVCSLGHLGQGLYRACFPSCTQKSILYYYRSRCSLTSPHLRVAPKLPGPRQAHAGQGLVHLGHAGYFCSPDQGKSPWGRARPRN